MISYAVLGEICIQIRYPKIYRLVLSHTYIDNITKRKAMSFIVMFGLF